MYGLPETGCLLEYLDVELFRCSRHSRWAGESGITPVLKKHWVIVSSFDYLIALPTVTPALDKLSRRQDGGLGLSVILQ